MAAFFGRFRSPPPFRIEATVDRYDPGRPADPVVFQKGRLDVHGIGGTFPGTLTLRVTATRETAVGRIGIEFSRRRFLRFVRADREKIRVTGVPEAGKVTKARRGRRAGRSAFSGGEDGSGGYEGAFRPALRLPPGGMLFLAVGIKADLRTEGVYRIVLRISGDGSRTRRVSLEVAFRNREPIDA